MTAIPERVTEMFGGAEPLGASPKTTDEWRILVEQGIPVSAVVALSRLIASDEKQVLTLLSIISPVENVLEPSSSAHLSARTPESNLCVPASERAERIARIFALAESVLRDKGEAGVFLFSPHPKLDGARPIDWIRTELGGREVEQLLTNIREGFPA